MVEKGSAHVTMCDSSGESYTGYWDWVMNRPQGRGKWVYPSGDVCEGLFDKGKATGKCVYTFANGDCYRGEMKHGKANGYGKKTFSDGSYYEGYFFRDMYDGKGFFLHCEENTELRKIENGTWRSGEMMKGIVTTYDKNGQVDKRVSFVRIV